MRKKLRIFTVYCESLFYTLHSKKLKDIHHWAGLIIERPNGNIQGLQFYSEADARKAVNIIKDSKCKLYRKKGSAFRSGISFEEIK